MVSFDYETMQFIFTHVIVKHCVDMHRVVLCVVRKHPHTDTHGHTNKQVGAELRLVHIRDVTTVT